ncbi:S41 family peptidase [bacterium]|jgi:C-terminal peptidase prc|nr:S41 family peptidase [bacterium]MBT6831948.1 S41 family peptidase [bacterium]MBT6996644.1 S41 family peptidase [bacterium]MBT7773064.1 S41 family peptidase [bacterium]
MRKFFIRFLTVGILISGIFSSLGSAMYQDINAGSTLEPALQTLIDRGVLDGKGFFRSSDNIPAAMFWEIVLRDSGFDPNSSTLGTDVPGNVDSESDLAQFLREASRRGFLTAAEKSHFDSNATISRIRAIEILVKTKALVIPRRTSNAFRDLLPERTPSRAGYWPTVEAAYASGILDNRDLTDLRPNYPLKRHELVTWIFNFLDHGTKQSRLEAENPFSYQRLRESHTEEKKSSPSSSTNIQKAPSIQIQILPVGSSTTLLPQQTLPNQDLLETIYSDVINRYRFSDELTPEKRKEMIDAAIAAMVKAAGDKYSAYIKPAQSQNFQENLDGKFEGIGAYVELIDEKLVITSPIVGSPAETAGILPGDAVIKVNDESIAGWALSDSVNKIKGPSGSAVKLTILREKKEVEITVVRGEITVPSVTLKWEKSVPIIGLHQFAHGTTSSFLEILKNDVLTKHPRGMVIDLRNDPGGFLTVAREIVEIFSTRGDKIYSTDYKTGDVPEYARRTGELAEFENIVVLQNKGTASASEILIGALQDHNRIKIVGTNSLGKGTVQSINNYSNGGMLKITIAKWLTPKGRWIHETGIAPDIEIADPTSEEKQQKIDRQLDRAVQEVLRQELSNRR